MPQNPQEQISQAVCRKLVSGTVPNSGHLRICGLDCGLQTRLQLAFTLNQTRVARCNPRFSKEMTCKSLTSKLPSHKLFWRCLHEPYCQSAG